MILDLVKVNITTNKKTLASLLYFDEMQNVNANPGLCHIALLLA